MESCRPFTYACLKAPRRYPAITMRTSVRNGDIVSLSDAQHTFTKAKHLLANGRS